MVGGQASSNVMESYFPILVDPTSGDPSKQGTQAPANILFIDRNGEKLYPEIVNAVLSGVMIETELMRESGQ